MTMQCTYFHFICNFLYRYVYVVGRWSVWAKNKYLCVRHNYPWPRSLAQK